MSDFHAFTHVERLSSEDCEGILNGLCYISPKIDGTNSCVWYDPDAEKVYCGSRKRIITPESDNAGFAAWVNNGIGGNPVEATYLVTLAMNLPRHQIFGEWLGSTKFIGHIKDYDSDALGHLWIFDIYDMDNEVYLEPNQVIDICEAANLGKWVIPQMPYNNPTIEDIARMAEENIFLLTHANHPGEGLVIRRPDFVNKYGHHVTGKYVRDEYKQKKSTPREPLDPNDMICGIIREFVTDAELSKAVAKTAAYFNEDEFSPKVGKMVGFYLNEVVNSCIYDEIKNICKKFKNPVIDFGALNAEVKIRARSYIGL